MLALTNPHALRQISHSRAWALITGARHVSFKNLWSS